MILRAAITMACAAAAISAGGLEAQSPRKPVAHPAAHADTDVATAIRALLDSSAAAWNRGDVKGHLATNADSIEFMTGHGPVVGNDSVLIMMREHYFRDGKPLQTLRFDRVTVRPLGKQFALAVGQFILTGGGRDDVSGWFSTIWEHRPEGWRVIHDHSS